MRSQHAYNTSCFKIIQFFHFFLLLKLLHIFHLYHMLWSRLTSIFYKFPSKLSCLNSHFITLIDSVSQEFRLSWEWSNPPPPSTWGCLHLSASHSCFQKMSSNYSFDCAVCFLPDPTDTLWEHRGQNSGESRKTFTEVALRMGL